jgi:anti-sigma regulatory factor (Ser/Thr protein kinase)
MTEMFLNMPALAGRIPDTVGRVARFGASAGCDEEACFQVQVMVAEALNNIVCHGLPEDAPRSVAIHCTTTEAGLEIMIRDHGLPLDQLPNAAFPDARAEHGRGWPIIREWADSIEYRSTPNHNDLTLIKRLS